MICVITMNINYHFIFHEIYLSRCLIYFVFLIASAHMSDFEDMYDARRIIVY